MDFFVNNFLFNNHQGEFCVGCRSINENVYRSLSEKGESVAEYRCEHQEHRLGRPVLQSTSSILDFNPGTVERLESTSKSKK